MNDSNYLHDKTNGVVSNTVVVVISTIACLLAMVSIPLQVFSGG
jgi:hypothetical protein